MYEINLYVIVQLNFWDMDSEGVNLSVCVMKVFLLR